MNISDKNKNSNIDLLKRYKTAENLWNDNNVSLNTTLYPHWIGNTDTFWYVRQLKYGKCFRLVNAKACTNIRAFDHEKLTRSLKKCSGENVHAEDLPLFNLDLKGAPARITFSAFGKRWKYDDERGECESLHDLDLCNSKLSPDGKYLLFCRDYNLWVRDKFNDQEWAITKDGERLYAYSSTPAVLGARAAPETLEALWSPNSTRIFTLVLDTRDVGLGIPLVEHVPEDGTHRPRLVDPDRRVAFPGDDYVDVYRFLCIDLETGETQFVKTTDCPITFMPYVGYFTGGRSWWDQDNRHVYFVEEERGMKTHRLQRVDTHTGVVKTLIEESSEHFVMLIPSTHVTPLFMPLPETNEVIWYSERSGTAHFYLYDTITGKLKKVITQGYWIVRNGLHVDTERRELTFQSAARIEGRNPYYCDICRVNIDTGELTEILSTDHEYIVCDRSSRVSYKYVDQESVFGVSPNANYIVTTRSRVDEMPTSLLLDRSGRELMVLEAPDISVLPEGFTWPEPVMLKAEDGETDIYSVIFRPSNFDPEKSYPVLDSTVGYCSPVGSFSNAHANFF